MFYYFDHLCKNISSNMQFSIDQRYPVVLKFRFWNLNVETWNFYFCFQSFDMFIPIKKNNCLLWYTKLAHFPDRIGKILSLKCWFTLWF